MKIVGIIVFFLLSIFIIHNARELVRFYRRKRKERREQSEGSEQSK